MVWIMLLYKWGFFFIFYGRSTNAWVTNLYCLVFPWPAAIQKIFSKVRSGPLVGWIPPWIDWSYAINCFAWRQWLSFLILRSRNFASQWCLFPHFLSLKQLSWWGVGFDPSIKIEPIEAGTIHFFLPTLFYFSSQLVEARPLFWNQFLHFHIGVQLLTIKSFYTSVFLNRHRLYFDTWER